MSLSEPVAKDASQKEKATFCQWQHSMVRLCNSFAWCSGYNCWWGGANMQSVGSPGGRKWGSPGTALHDKGPPGDHCQYVSMGNAKWNPRRWTRCILAEAKPWSLSIASGSATYIGHSGCGQGAETNHLRTAFAFGRAGLGIQEPFKHFTASFEANPHYSRAFALWMIFIQTYGFVWFDFIIWLTINNWHMDRQWQTDNPPKDRKVYFARGFWHALVLLNVVELLTYQEKIYHAQLDAYYEAIFRLAASGRTDQLRDHSGSLVSAWGVRTCDVLQTEYSLSYPMMI